MKLLSKKQVTQDVARQRKEKIDEGVAIAKKIDVLRDTLGKEEQGLKKFRTETVSQVTQEIHSKILERDSLLKEIEELHKRRLEELTPLDEDWNRLHIEDIKLDKRRTVLDNREILISESEQRNAERANELLIEKDRISEERRLSSIMLNESTDLRIESQTLLSQARDKAYELTQNAELRMKDVKIREGNLTAQETSLALRKKQLEDKEQDLIEKETWLKDREEELDKAFNELRRKQNG